MGGTDKTSWLEGLEHDADAPFAETDPANAYTETLGAGWTDTTVTPLGEAKTVLSTSARADRTQIAIGRAIEEDGAAAMEDPVTGWLVVIKGPGMGRSMQIGAGLNTLGRSDEERVPMPFGDPQISSHDHLRIIYDDESRSFMAVPGTGKNVSRMNGQIIAMPVTLENYATIQLTKQTAVRFVAFCNAGFDWADLAGDGEGK
ncbi:FHA domain-containing protein [Rhodobacter capsulatus]|uniref:FHA domain-containing protein n=1 Tax=Rhodobacter capsulatus TaxID=1061 RepID=A0A1G7CT07_RHOCA|nr:FHA domain-containing protein [Rhodobacter capsulatus]WER10778.1 FHA domain-containing protein [Rhodobacter capsulatus]SDE42383.1 hypothetical protein SAMN04244550_00369 [Rhodobacter capsulatus]